jgi:hypothetical protein
MHLPRWRRFSAPTGSRPRGSQWLDDWAALERLWEHRNVMAHRGGVVDTRHSTATGTEPGTILQPSPAEVQAAIDQIGAARYALVAAVWVHLSPEMRETIAEGTSVPVGESLRAGRWQQAADLTKTQLAFTTDPEVAATSKVNRWLAIEIGNGPQAIREEVLEWDLTRLPARFQMARHLLLREDADGLTILRRLLAGGALTRADLAEWPLFFRLREDGQLDDVLSE